MTKSIPRIVVGFDGTPAAERALTWAADVARLRREPLAVVVVEPRAVSRSRVWPEHWYDGVVTSARAVLATMGAPEATVTKPVGEVVHTLLEASEGSSMLVVGSAGHGRIAEMLAGSVSQRAARHARGPVVVVREHRHPAGTRYGQSRIVVGADDSEPSRRALDFACSQGAATTTPVVLVRAWKPALLPLDEHGDVPARLSSRLLEEEEALLKSVAEARGRHPEVDIDGQFVAERPGQALVDASHTASLVVVGSRGHGALGEAVLGSVSHHVLRHAKSPVAVVR